MTVSDRRTLKIFAIASLGGMLEFYDFVIFVFFTSYIGKIFFPPDLPAWLRQTEVWGLFSAGYLARPVGGVVMAHVGDRSGRKRMFVLGVLLMALPTFAIGLLPGYGAIGIAAPLLLLACRLLQGAAIGGEVPGAWVFVAEHASANRTGFACGLLTAGLTCGIFLGSLVNAVIVAALPPDAVASYGWRAAFLLGGVFGLAGAALRRQLSETPIFEAMQREARLARGLPAATVLQRHGPAVAVSMLATWLLTALIVVLILMGPGLLHQHSALTMKQIAGASLVATFALAVGCVLCGAVIDRIGRRPAVLLAGLVAILAGYVFVESPADPRWLMVLYGLVGLMTGAVTVVPAFMVKAFPPEVAYSGVSLSYNLAYALAGGLTPPMIIQLNHLNRVFPAHYIALVGVAASVAMVLSIQARERSAVVA